MNSTHRSLLITALSLFFGISICFAYAPTHLKPITWQGPKWEYLVEHPHVSIADSAYFNEILDTAGQHGWRLVSATHEGQFFTFYFERPLQPHRINAHRARLARVKSYRAGKESEIYNRINTALADQNKQLHPDIIEHLKRQAAQQQKQKK